MDGQWREMSYNRFPSFVSQFQRAAYEEQPVRLDIYNKIFDEVKKQEDNKCLAWKNKFMCTL